MKISAKQMRIDILKMGYAARSIGAHFGGSLSLVEIFSALYSFINFDPKNTADENRDRVILSKGHGVMAQYAALKQLGLYSDDDIVKFKTDDAILYAHPSMNTARGIEFSSGSLGQGLSLGVGVALGLKRKNLNSKVYVIVGDGECNEGSVWEAAMSAAHYTLDNLVLIIDKNDLQYDGTTKEILKMDLNAKFRAFGFDVIECDGHDENALLNAYKAESLKPKAIIAKTIKGKGVSFMENVTSWHYGVLNESNFNLALSEVENA